MRRVCGHSEMCVRCCGRFTSAGSLCAGHTTSLCWHRRLEASDTIWTAPTIAKCSEILHQLCFFSFWIRRELEINLVFQQILILCFRASQYKSNETPTWCNTVQVLFLQSHSTYINRNNVLIQVIMLMLISYIFLQNTCTSDRCTSFKYSWWWALAPETCRVTLRK